MVSVAYSSVSTATAAVGAATLVIAIALKKKKERYNRRGNFPSSSPWYLPSLDLMFAIRAGSLDKFFTNRAKALKSDTFYMKFPGINESLVVTNPRDQAEVMRKEGKLNFVVDMPDTLDDTHGPGSLQALHGTKHNFFRKIFASILHPSALESFTPFLHEAFKNMWKEIEEECSNNTSDTVVIQDSICKAQFFLMAKILYGMTPENTSMEVMLQLRQDFEAQLEGHFSPRGSAKFIKAKEGSERIHKILAGKFDSVLKERRALYQQQDSGDEEKKDDSKIDGSSSGRNIGNAMDVVADALLKEGVDTDEKVLSETIDNLDLLLEASHGTTMTVTTNTLYYLNLPENKDKLDKLRTEMKGLGIEPTYTQMKNNMSYADAVIKESMRICPIIVSIAYKSDEEMSFSLKGQKLQAPISITLAFGQNFTDERFFPQPDSFIPERWLSDSDLYVSDEAQKAFMPFGAGRHLCLGFKLADLVLKSALYCFASDEKRVIEFDHSNVAKKAGIFPSYSISDGFPGRVSRATCS
ncbi:hypothetical protein ACHAWT_005898 [Skeletonema menzelii]